MVEILNLVLVLLLVLANGFFVASEFALVGVRRTRVAALADSGDKTASRLLGVVDNLNAYISATQLGITLSSLALGWIGEPAIAHLLEAPLHGVVSDTVLHTISFAVAFSIITFLHIVLGELAPKTLALEMAERTALAIALPMQIFYRVFYYPIRLLDWAGTRTVRLFGLHPSGEHASIYTEDELRTLINISHQSGHLEGEEQQLINSVFEFSDSEVREAMIPRTSVDAISIDTDLEVVKERFRSLGYSRLPVFRDDVDNVVGVLFRRDIEPFLESPNGFAIERLLRPARFVPETAKLGPVLRQMQRTKNHFAIVVDEHGGMEGIVTLEDLLEEIVGEINDEFDEEVRSQVVHPADGSYRLDGMLAVRDANKQLELNLPEDGGYTTIAGFLMAVSGKVLVDGDTVEDNGVRFELERTENRRIVSIRLFKNGDKSASIGSSIGALLMPLVFLESLIL